jgi:LPS-assembly lipoprotein
MVWLRLAVLGVSLGLAGCGAYRPLYGTASNGTSVAASLSEVSVNQQRTRAGQLVRNEVQTSSDSGVVSRFELQLVPIEKTTSVSDLAGTKTKRRRYNLSVAYQLVDLKSGNLITKGTSFSNVSYDIVREPVADLQATNSAQSRAAQEVGQDLRLRLAAFISSHSS